jgi:hypothetical protein
MTKTDNLRFGFFFTASSVWTSELYFVGFQCGLMKSNAHQVIIADVRHSTHPGRKAVYVIDPYVLGQLNDAQLENLCRLAVSQFLDKFVAGNFNTCLLPLELSGTPWEGEILAI